ncbi:MAG TPA: YchJ family metal-binding protein [Parachlamydiaceae bacterium]|nr:YchJ family metal-binding protein [Parachlamydiaceae bacterium]
MKALCRCGSGEIDEKCCFPFHQGALPKTALELMRSRYTAYAMGNADYILKTTHKDNRESHKSAKLQMQQILSFCQNTEFNGLKILEVREGDLSSTVTFHVILSQNNHDASFTEKSFFEKVNGAWFYLKGEVTADP